MSDQDPPITRRGLLKAGGLATLGAALGVPRLAAAAGKPAAEAPRPTPAAPDRVVPRRRMARAGVDVPVLGLGLPFDVSTHQLFLKQALKWGVSLWMTGYDYDSGNAQRGIGNYFARFPADRDRVFLGTNYARGPSDLHRSQDLALEESLERMKTNRLDLLLYSVTNEEGDPPDALEDWAAKAKADGRVRHVGLAAHHHMDRYLAWAARRPGIDIVLCCYNYRLSRDRVLVDALAAAERAGVGILAMKTRALGPAAEGGEADQELLAHFVRKGETLDQARLRAVWANPSIRSAVVTLASFEALGAMVQAATESPALSASDARALARHDDRTRSGYCAGCTHLCQPAVAASIPIGDVLRHLMYGNAYGERDRAARWFAGLPEGIRSALGTLDFSMAESRCPRGVPIARLMREAATRWC